MTKQLIDGRDKNIKARKESGETLIDYLLRRNVCFCVIQHNSWGGIMDTFVVVHEDDYFRVEERFVKSKCVRGCLVADLEEADFLGFKARQLRHFSPVNLGQSKGTVYELIGNSFKSWCYIRNTRKPVKVEEPEPESKKKTRPARRSFTQKL